MAWRGPCHWGERQASPPAAATLPFALRIRRIVPACSDPGTLIEALERGSPLIGGPLGGCGVFVTRMAILANLLAYSTVVSQPLFYIVALTSAQRALSGPAYVELRQRINTVMNRRVPVIYLTALATTLVLIVLSWRAGMSRVFITTILALLCLLGDLALMLRENAPINGAIDRWSPTNHPEDWEAYRSKWFAIFAYRQIILLLGLISLLIGAVFQS